MIKKLEESGVHSLGLILVAAQSRAAPVRGDFFWLRLRCVFRGSPICYENRKVRLALVA